MPQQQFQSYVLCTPPPYIEKKLPALSVRAQLLTDKLTNLVTNFLRTILNFNVLSFNLKDKMK